MSATPEVRCPFCDRINRFEYEAASPSTVRFEPLNPVTAGHMLFVPGGHIEHGPLARDFVAAAMGAAEKYGVERGEGFNLIISSGPDATQTVAHVHVHYVPRRPGDGLPLPWTPQQAAVTPVDPQGAATPAGESLLTPDRIKDALFPLVVPSTSLATYPTAVVPWAAVLDLLPRLAATPAGADTADLDSAVGIIEGVQHALALTKGARATAEERVYTTEANRLIHERRERMLQARLTDGTTAGRAYARTGGDEHATTPPVAATSEEGR